MIDIVDDEKDILELVALHLERSGFRVRKFLLAKPFLRELSIKQPDLIILDLMLPDIDGIEVCKFLKSHEEYGDIPIIMLTARATETDKVLGLELGADDYVTKPFSPRELVARVKAVLRRGGRQEEKEDKKIQIGGILSIDPFKFEVYVRGKRIELTPTEFKILKMLAEKKGWVFTRKQILDELWGYDKIVLDRTVDVHIKHLREKLGEAGKFIKNVRGVGYKIEG